MKISYLREDQHIAIVISLLEKAKNNSNFSVIDVGGAINDWSWRHVNYILDFVEPQYNASQNNPIFVKGDITREEGWEEITNYVKENGKFDFSICRQTLEDLNNPEFVCKKLSQISKSGFISVPSKYSELKKGLYASLPNTRGFHHHRWIFVTKDKKVYGLPKMGWTDSFSDNDLYLVNTDLGGLTNVSATKQELALFWKDEIKITFLISTIDNLPRDYDENISNLSKNFEHPWDLWKHLLNNSD